MFGTDALQLLLDNVLNGRKDATRNINRLDNGVPMHQHVHGSWDSMRFFLEVMWDSYNESTKEVIQVLL